MTRQPSTRPEPRTTAGRAQAAERRVAALEDERDSFKRLMLVAGGRVAALEEGLRALLDADDGVSWTALEAARDKARALLAESEASDE